MADKAKSRAGIAVRMGERIAERRKALSWTQEELAERLGLDAESVSRFERGVTAPSIATLQRLARTLRTNSAYLLWESAAEPATQAVKISAWLDALPESDRTFVVGHVKRLCEHIRKTNKR